MNRQARRYEDKNTVPLDKLSTNDRLRIQQYYDSVIIKKGTAFAQEQLKELWIDIEADLINAMRSDKISKKRIDKILNEMKTSNKHFKEEVK
jgi:hypothetical protein